MARVLKDHTLCSPAAFGAASLDCTYIVPTGCAIAGLRQARADVLFDSSPLSISGCGHCNEKPGYEPQGNVAWVEKRIVAGLKFLLGALWRELHVLPAFAIREARRPVVFVVDLTFSDPDVGCSFAIVGR